MFNYSEANLVEGQNQPREGTNVTEHGLKSNSSWCRSPESGFAKDMQIEAKNAFKISELS